jgi:hypothetical protein
MNSIGAYPRHNGFFGAYMNPEQYVWQQTVIPSPYPIYAEDKRPGPSTNIPANLYGDAHPLFGTRQLAQKQLNEKIQKLLEDEKVVAAFKKAIVDKKNALNRAFSSAGGTDNPDDVDALEGAQKIFEAAEKQVNKKASSQEQKKKDKKANKDSKKTDELLDEFYKHQGYEQVDDRPSFETLKAMKAMKAVAKEVEATEHGRALARSAKSVYKVRLHSELLNTDKRSKQTERTKKFIETGEGFSPSEVKQFRADVTSSTRLVEPFRYGRDALSPVSSKTRSKTKGKAASSK